ncbi:MAG: DUF3575 domain-containing protein [Bacteroidetes bacterium]|nr:DUF3575 domain-containing protein [Bacteroidota bacterium]
MKFIATFYLLFSVSQLFSQTTSLLGPIAGLNTNNYGLGVMYRKHLSDHFYLEGAVSLPCIVGYGYENSFIGYNWSYTTLGLNAGFNLFDYEPLRHNFGLSAGISQVYGANKETSGRLIGGSLTYSYLLNNHWNIELNAGLGMLTDFEESYPIPVFGLRYSKVHSNKLEKIAKEERVPLFNPQPPDYRTVVTASVGVSPMLFGLSIQQYFTGFIALEGGLGLLSANANLKIYPLNGFDGIIDPYLGAEIGYSWFEFVPLNYFMLGLEIKPRFGGYESGYRFGIDVGPFTYGGDGFLGLNLRLSKAFNDRFR